MSDEERERARMKLEDAVWAMLEAGYSEDEVREEVNYAIDGHEG